MSKETNKTAKPQGNNGSARFADAEYGDADLCPRLAAMCGLYSLLIAAKKNTGAATIHIFRNVELTLLDEMLRAAEREGFQATGKINNCGQCVITVKWILR